MTPALSHLAIWLVNLTPRLSCGARVPTLFVGCERAARRQLKPDVRKMNVLALHRSLRGPSCLERCDTTSCPATRRCPLVRSPLSRRGQANPGVAEPLTPNPREPWFSKRCRSLAPEAGGRRPADFWPATAPRRGGRTDGDRFEIGTVDMKRGLAQWMACRTKPRDAAPENPGLVDCEHSIDGRYPLSFYCSHLP